MATGLLLALLGVWLITRTVVKGDNGNLVDRVLKL